MSRLITVLFVGIILIESWINISNSRFSQFTNSNRPPPSCSGMYIDLIANDPWHEDPRWFTLRSNNPGCNGRVWLTLFDRPAGRERPQVQLDVVTASIVGGQVTIRSNVPLPCYFQIDLNFGPTQQWESPWMVVDRARPGETRQGISATNYFGPEPASCRGPSPTPTPTPTPPGPAAPTNITVVEGDANGGAIIQTRAVRVNWSYPDGGSGCGGTWNSSCPGSGNKFTVSFSGATTVPGRDVGSTTRTLTTGADLRPNGNYTVRVCADNGPQEACATRAFTKVPYPTGYLSGDLAERAPNAAPAACVNGVRAARARLELNPPTSGITSTCSISPTTGTATRYSCSVTLDNVNYDPDPSPDFTIVSETNPLYANSSCGTSCTSNGSCTNIYRPTFDANNSPGTIGSQNIYFNLNPNSGYYRIKNSSYYDRNSVTSLFPVNNQPFDADDLPDDGHFSRGDSPTNIAAVGVVMSNGAQTVGETGATYSGVSPRGWSSDTYREATSDVSIRLIDYIKNRAEHLRISGLSDPRFQAATFGTFVIDGDVTINPSNVASFNNKNVFVAVTGKLNIETNFIPTNAGTAFVANSVFIRANVSEIRALITANTLSLLGDGETGPSTTPLKIVGTISSGVAVNTNNRSRGDAFKPSVFIVSNPDIYSRLLPMISVTRYDWQQLQ